MPPRQVLDDDIVLIRVRAKDFDSVVGRRNDNRVRPILMISQAWCRHVPDCGNLTVPAKSMTAQKISQKSR
jgi:hypothetical protein